MKWVYLTLISCAFILGAKAAERSKDVATPKRDGKGTTDIHSLYFKRSWRRSQSSYSFGFLKVNLKPFAISEVLIEGCVPLPFLTL